MLDHEAFSARRQPRPALRADIVPMAATSNSSSPTRRTIRRMCIGPWASARRARWSWWTTSFATGRWSSRRPMALGRAAPGTRCTGSSVSRSWKRLRFKRWVSGGLGRLHAGDGEVARRRGLWVPSRAFRCVPSAPAIEFRRLADRKVPLSASIAILISTRSCDDERSTSRPALLSRRRRL